MTGATVSKIDIGDRVYATEKIDYSVTDPDGWRVDPGDEGVVIEITGDDGLDLGVEWDAGFVGQVNSGSVALAPAGGRVVRTAAGPRPGDRVRVVFEGVLRPPAAG